MLRSMSYAGRSNAPYLLGKSTLLQNALAEFFRQFVFLKLELAWVSLL